MKIGPLIQEKNTILTFLLNSSEQHAIQTALVDKVVEDFLDIATPLKQLTDCVAQPPPAGM
jgi:hypothetical protein